MTTETTNFMASTFLKLFGKSPFQPLFDHMATVYQCAKRLPDFFVAIEQGDWDKALKQQLTINELEHQADVYKRDFRLNLPRDLFLPVARRDLLDLISHQDHIANAAEDVAGLVVGRKMQLPEPLVEPFNLFVSRCTDAAKQAFKAIRELKDLYDAGFSGKETGIINEMIDTLYTIEHDTDEMQINLRQEVFKLESTLPPVEVIFLYEVIKLTGQLADHAQKIGDRLQICIAR